MAICVIAVVGVAPCQCLTPGGNQITSPGRTSSIGPPSCWTHPQPDEIMSVCPKGCVCHAVRAPGSNVTLFPAVRVVDFTENNGSIRTAPVNQSSGPLADGWDPTLVTSIANSLVDVVSTGAWENCAPRKRNSETPPSCSSVRQRRRIESPVSSIPAYRRIQSSSQHRAPWSTPGMRVSRHRLRFCSLETRSSRTDFTARLATRSVRSAGVKFPFAPCTPSLRC